MMHRKDGLFPTHSSQRLEVLSFLLCFSQGLRVLFVPSRHIFLLCFEDFLCHVVEVIPLFGLVQPQVLAHALDQCKQILHAAVDVWLSGVGVGAELVLWLVWAVFHYEVPVFFVRSVHVCEFTLFVFLGSQLV